MKETKRSASNSTAVKEQKPVASKTETATKPPSKGSSEEKVVSVTELANVPVLEFAHETISKEAYLLWEKEGYQHGRENEYWLRAEELLKQKKS